MTRTRRLRDQSRWHRRPRRRCGNPQRGLGSRPGPASLIEPVGREFNFRGNRSRLQCDPRPDPQDGRSGRCIPSRSVESLGFLEEVDRIDAIGWLLDSDPAIRWEVMRDLIDASDDEVAAERARVATEGWGAGLLALQREDGHWDKSIPARL